MSNPQKQKLSEKRQAPRQASGVGRERAAQLEEPDLAALQRAVARPAMAAPADMLTLQRSNGNRAVQRLLAQCQPTEADERTSVESRPSIQRQGSGYTLEQEADIQVRRPVMQKTLATQQPAPIERAVIQRGIWDWLVRKFGRRRVPERIRLPVVENRPVLRPPPVSAGIIRKQGFDTTCGLACAAMVKSAHGTPVTIQDMLLKHQTRVQAMAGQDVRWMEGAQVGRRRVARAQGMGGLSQVYTYADDLVALLESTPGRLAAQTHLSPSALQVVTLLINATRQAPVMVLTQGHWTVCLGPSGETRTEHGFTVRTLHILDPWPAASDVQYGELWELGVDKRYRYLGSEPDDIDIIITAQ